MTLSLSFGVNVREPRQIETFKFNDFAELAGTFEAAIHDCDANSKLELPYICAGTFKVPRRAKNNLTGADVLILDIDEEWSIEDARRYLVQKGWAYFIYTSWSHSAETDRFRIIIPLDRRCTPNEYTAICKTLVADGVKGLDSTKFGAESAMFLTTSQRLTRTLTSTGRGLPVDATIALHGVTVAPKRTYERPAIKASRLTEWNRNRTGSRCLHDLAMDHWWSDTDVAWWFGREVWHSSMPALAVKLHHSIKQRHRIKTTASEVQEVLVAFLQMHTNPEFQTANLTDQQIKDAMAKASLQGQF